MNENVNFIVTNAQNVDSVSQYNIINIDVILMHSQLLKLYQEQVPSVHVVTKKFIADSIDQDELAAAEEYLVK